MAKAVGKYGFLFFFAKNLCRAPMAKAVGKDGFLFF
jgi:protein-tyrosine-phosphatase